MNLVGISKELVDAIHQSLSLIEKKDMLYWDILKTDPECAKNIFQVSKQITKKINIEYNKEETLYPEDLSISLIDDNDLNQYKNGFDFTDYAFYVLLDNKNISNKTYIIKIKYTTNKNNNNSWASSIKKEYIDSSLEGPFINSPGYDVPLDSIVIVPRPDVSKNDYEKIICSLKNNKKRDWFTSHFYYCLPLVIGNQYGFLIKSSRDFEAVWDGSDNPANITFLDDDDYSVQSIINGFGHGIITIQNKFSIRTPVGINIMTIQPPNMFIPGCSSMTGVVESDNLRRDFTFNLKITVPNFKIRIKRGDPVGAFIPIPRNFVDNFILKDVLDVFSKETYSSEVMEYNNLSIERHTEDMFKPHSAGRRYFKGINFDNSKYTNHQTK